MQAKKLTETKLRTPEFRISFPHVFKQAIFEGKEQGYTVTALMTDNKETRKFQEFVKEAVNAAAKKKWKQQRPKKLKTPTFDSESDRPEAAEKIVARFRSQQKPFVIDAYRNPIENHEDVYGGAYGIAVVEAYAWDNQFGKGVSLSLLGLQKTRNGVPFLSGATEDDFEDIDADEEEDEGEDDPFK